MLASEKGFNVGDDVGLFEESFEGRSDLFLNVVVVVNGDVFFQYFDGVFCVFIVLGPFCAFNHDVSYSVSDSQNYVLVSFLHLGS